MRYIFNKLSVTAGAAMLAAMSLGQSYSSFNQVDGIYGVFVNNTGLSYTVSLDPGAYLMFNNQQLDITDCFGFWALRQGQPLSASGQSQNGWGWDQSTNGSGSIAGWHNPSKTFAIQPGQQLTFTYDSLDQPNVEALGFHFSFVQDWPLTPGNKTAFVSGPLNPVPEPVALAVMGIGALGMLLRRKRYVDES
jgi:hypothetical protein